MKWCSRTSRGSDLVSQVQDAGLYILEQFEGQSPDVVFVFVSAQFRGAFDQIPRLLVDVCQPAQIFGACGGGILADGDEVEMEPGLAVMAGLLPDVFCHSFSITPEEFGDLDSAKLIDKIGVPAENSPSFVLLFDPFSCPLDPFLHLMDQTFPFSQKIGGLVSGGQGPGQHALFHGGHCTDRGMVGLVFDGNLAMDTMVAQGCRPIGSPLFLTSVAGSVIREINGEVPRAVLESIYAGLSEPDRQLFRHALFVGIEMQPEDRIYNRGDFLIRNLMGIDPNHGFLQVGADLTHIKVAQFHVRDTQTSRDDLRLQLDRYQETLAERRPVGALMFSCLGRGIRFYDEPNVDSGLVHSVFDGLPMGGFFCNGEIGPVQGRTFVHGYTSSLGFLRPRHG
ncbi:FIST signal transduction protein [Acanthopleuribacter pedis]|uniref:FIST C-terminal domain-containing protein n=1 Tax=Acanthopleuribacter pedis TaxID=442870 RepID=A0A8J7U3U6_9BACT|nr:FIST N-terminal domain-containing protein [Acanthopleuribacter pedis]MBO1320808.1 FIST C-terminal domain-containing protein [Acanthopleuribacter pedis]